MWKLVVLTLLCTLAESRLREEAYKTGREYVYRYETQIVTGRPGESNIYSGIKLRAKVRLQFPGETLAKLQLEDVITMKVNDAIEEADPTRHILPDSMFQTMAGEEIDVIERYLTMPCQFAYIRGHVTEFQTEKDEPIWSANIKRGIVSMFEMNIDAKMSLEDNDLYTISAPVSATIPMKFLTTIEPTPVGECETSYEIRPSASSVEENEFVVTKVRDYKNCINRPTFTTSMAAGYFCSDCEREKTLTAPTFIHMEDKAIETSSVDLKKNHNPIESTGRIEYSITGNVKRFVIVSAIGVEHTFVTPFSKKHDGKFATVVRQHFVLEDAVNAREQIPQLAQPFIHPTGLKINIEEAYQSHLNPFQFEIIARKIDMEKEEAVEHTTAVFDKYMEAQLATANADYSVFIVQTLRNASVNAVKKIIEKYGTAPTTREVLFRLLPVCGTKACTRAIFEAINDNTIPVHMIGRMLNILSTFDSDENMIRECIALARNPIIIENEEAWWSVWRSLGAWGRRLENWNRTTVEEIKHKVGRIQRVLVNTKPRHIENELLRLLRTEQNALDQTTIMYIKIKQDILTAVTTLLRSVEPEKQLLGLITLGNTGWKEIVPLVTPFLAEGNSRLLRLNALQSLRKAAWRVSSQIAAIVVPIFLDQRQPHDVRITAFQAVMSSNPSQEVMNMIAGSLEDEVCLQVGGFVYSTLVEISNRTEPCWQNYARKAGVALRIAKRFVPAYLASQFKQYAVFSERNQMGGAIDVSMIGSHDSVVPQGGSVKLNAYMFGFNADVAELGFHSESLKTIISKMFGPGASVNMRKSLFSILKHRTARGVGELSQAEIQAIIEKLGIHPRKAGEPWGHAFLRFFGNEYYDYILDQKFLEEILLSGALGMSWNEEALRIGKPVDWRRPRAITIVDHYVPSAAGVPIQIDLEVATDSRINGTVALDIQKSVFANVNTGIAPRKIELATNLKFSLDMKIRGKMNVIFPFIHTGISVKTGMTTKTPINMVATVDLAKQKIFTKFTMPPEEKMVCEIVTEPKAYIWRSNLINPLETSISTKVIDIVHGAQMQKYEKTIELAGLTIGMKYIMPRMPDLPIVPLSGLSIKRIFVKPTAAAPVTIEVQAQLTDAQIPFAGAGIAQPPRTKEDSSGLWSYLGSWVPASPASGANEDAAIRGGFHNLKHKDVSVHDIAEKLNKPLTDTSGGSTYGLVFVVATEGGAKPFTAQCEMLITEGEAPTQKTVAMKYKRSPLAMESEPWETTFDAKISLPSVQKTIDAVIQPEHLGVVLTELREKLPLLKVEQLKSILPKHYIKQFNRIVSYSHSPVVVDEILVNLIEKLPIPNKGLIKNVIADQIAAEVTMKRVFYKSMKPLLLQHFMMEMKKIADICGVIIDKVQQQGLAESPVEIPLIQYILAKQIKIHAKLERIVEVAKTVSRNRMLLGQSDGILSQVQEQQKVIMQHQLRLIKSVSIRQAAEAREVISTMTEKDAKLYGSVQELERQQAGLVKDLYEHGINALRGTLKAHVKIISRIQDGIIGAVEAGHIPDEKIVIKAAGVMISQEEIIRAVLNRLPMQGRAPNKIPKEILSELPVLQLRTSLMIKSIPIISDIIEHKVIVTPNLVKSDVTLYHLLLQVEIQQSFLALKSALFRHNEQSTDIGAYTSHVKQYLLTAEHLSNVLNTRMVEKDFIIKGIPLEVLIKLIKVATWHEKVIRQCETAARFNNKLPSGEIYKLLKENDVMLWEKTLEIIARLKPIIEAYKNSLITNIAIEPITEIQVTEIQAVQMRTKKILASIAKRGASPIILGEMIKKIVRECKIINSKLRMIVRSGGIQEVMPQVAPNQLSPIKESQQEIISGIIKIIETSVGVPNTEALMRKVLEQKAMLEGVISIMGGASAIPGVQSGVGAGVGSGVNVRGNVGAERISPYASNAGVGAGSWLGPKYGVRGPSGTEHVPRAGLGGRPANIGAISAKISIDAILTRGYEGSMKEKIIIKVIGQKSVGQLLWEFEQATVLGRGRRVRQYTIDRAIGRGPVSIERFELQKEINMYRDINVIINYEQAPPSNAIKNVCLFIRDALKHRWYKYLDVTVPEEVPTPETVLMQIEFPTNNQEMDVVLRTSEEVNTYRGIIIPAGCRRLMPALPLGPLGGPGGAPQLKIPRPVFSKGICEISGRFIRTVDGIVYPVKEVPGCEAVVAMDCSPNSLFAVKISGIREQVKSMAITVLAGGQTVVVKPVSVGETVVLLNGNAVVVPEGQTVTVNGEGSALSSATIKLTKIKNVVSVEAPIAGIAVVADVAKIRIRVSPYYMGQVCGLCGNYDGEISNEFEDPALSVYGEPEPFWSRYMLPSATCDAASLTQKFQSFAPISQGGCLPTLQTEVFPRRVGREKEICFSTEAVNKCPKTCKPVGAATKAVGFSCMKAGEPRAQELLQQSMVKPIEPAALPRVEFEKELAIPQGCEAA